MDTTLLIATLSLVVALLSAIVALFSLGWQIYLYAFKHRLKVSCQMSSAKAKGIPEIVWSVVNTGQARIYIQEMVIFVEAEDGKSDEGIFQAADLTKEGIDTNTRSVRLESAQNKKFSDSRSGDGNKARMPESFFWIAGRTIKCLAVRDGSGNLWEAPPEDVQEINRQMKDSDYRKHAMDNITL